MSKEFLKPMLEISSPRVLNINFMTKNILEKDPSAKLFFACRNLNKVVLIKDTDYSGRDAQIGTKLYFPFNENDVYDGGRTIFVHAPGIESALISHFGEGALPKEDFQNDMRILRILNKIPSLDPFLLKDVFITEQIDMNPDYFEVSDKVWEKIESYILQGFAPLAKAAFPEALSSDDVARKLINKMWEGRDLETLNPMIKALRIPEGKEHETFAAWKGIMFYGFQYEHIKADMADITAWMTNIHLPVAGITPGERREIMDVLDSTGAVLFDDLAVSEQILQDYQNAYDKIFKYKQGSGDFLKFIQNSNSYYNTLGNKLGKISHAVYCWQRTVSRYPGRRLPWDALYILVTILSKILVQDKV